MVGRLGVVAAAALAAALAAAMAPSSALGHGGGLNAEGCHNNRKTGDYHCHRGSSSRSKPARKPTRPVVAPPAKATLVSVPAPTEEVFVGRVVGVTDGDTIKVMRAGRAVTVRVHGIDAPEKRQAFGDRARRTTASLVADVTVSVVVRDRDRYGRIVGHVFLPGDRSLARELVGRGMAWVYRKYSNDAGLRSAELLARMMDFGLWADKAPVPPWEFRGR
jgi:endonuclease YncB( thermonuclease family)